LGNQLFLTQSNLEDNIGTLGRVACVKFDNIIDALALYTKEAKVMLPMNSGKLDEPIVYPSKYLLKFLEEFNPLTFQVNFGELGKFWPLKV
jgi:hypothetical protein